MDENSPRPSQVLAQSEVELLRRALLEWGGPARCSDELAAAIGFRDFADLVEESRRIREMLAKDVQISRVDWARTLLGVEIVFVSDLAGSGVEWATTTGFGDEVTVMAIRSVQRKLASVVRPYYGRRPQ